MSARQRPILVTGVAGMLGRAVNRIADRRGQRVIGFDRTGLDITDAARVRDVLGQIRPDVIMNLAAYTAVDRAESEPDRALAVNQLGAANVAAACAEIGARMIHISTDYVFDGSARRPYCPVDETNPINTYGRTKLLGEQSVRAELADHVILRTSWLFAPWGNNFVRTIAQRARARKPLRIVADQCGRPTSALDLANVLLELADRQEVRGTLHFANAGATTWHGFAEGVVGMLEERDGSDSTEVVPISTADFQTAATRPAYSVLDTEAFTAATGIVPRNWRSAVSETLAELE